jgi:hypothetical protein
MTVSLLSLTGIALALPNDMACAVSWYVVQREMWNEVMPKPEASISEVGEYRASPLGLWSRFYTRPGRRTILFMDLE